MPLWTFSHFLFGSDGDEQCLSCRTNKTSVFRSTAAAAADDDDEALAEAAVLLTFTPTLTATLIV